MTTSDNQLSGLRNPKALPKAKLAQKKDHGHCLVVCCLSDPRQLSESQRNHHIFEVRSAHRWDATKTVVPAAGTGQQKGPSSLHGNGRLHIAHPMLQKLNRAREFCLDPQVQNACCVSRHGNNTNLTANFHQSFWVTRYVISEQYFETNLFCIQQQISTVDLIIHVAHRCAAVQALSFHLQSTSRVDWHHS